MAVTLSVAQLAAALRLGDSAEETAEVTRLLAFATEAVTKHAPNAADTAMNEAVRRLAGYLFDQPEASRGDAYANAMRNSGTARMLLPYRVHRLGIADAVTAAQQAVGSVGNPVVGLAVESGQLVVTFADGTTDTLDLPAGMGDGTDQQARDSAAAAQTAATAAGVLAGSKDDAFPWATEGNSDTMPAVKHRLALTDARGAVAGAGSNDIVDAESDSAIRGWRLSHIFRILTRKVEAWARKGANTLIPPTALFGVNHATNRLVAVSTEGAFQLIEADTPDDGGSAEPIVLFALAPVAGDWQEITLTQPITTGFLIEFRLSGIGNGGGEYGLATASAILATTAASSNPGTNNYRGALPIKTMNAADQGFGHDVLLLRKSDEDNKLWVKTGREVATSWEITSHSLGGGS